MYEFAFASTPPETPAPPLPPYVPGASMRPARRVVSPFWQEHCVECAVPECYGVCALYVARRDGACARFAYGIAPAKVATGAFDVGADILFRPWAKLEAALCEGGKAFDGPGRVDHDTPGTALGDGASVLRAIAGTDALRVVVGVPAGEAPGALIVEAFTVSDSARRTLSRRRLTLETGWNEAEIPTAELGLDPGLDDAWLLVHPERPDSRLLFAWLDFVAWERAVEIVASESDVTPADKVKVVVWDLDNTVWDGILAEGGGGADHVRPAVRAAMAALDARGILQSVASKNDHAVAFAELERAGLAEYILFPAIHWGQKSESLKTIAARLNLGLDAFVFIDDSAHERAEVRAHVPGIRVLTDADVAGMLDDPAFDVPITELSRRRRETYRVALARDAAREVFGADHEAFIASCQMELRVFTPASDAEIARCHELIMRSNQLNLSGRRLERDALEASIADPDYEVLALACIDRFGDYGIVGCVIVDGRGDWPLFRDMVVSCRVAEKRVEAAFFRWYMTRALALGHDRLFARLVTSDKNRPMMRALEQGGFTLAKAGETQLLYSADIEAVLAARPLSAEPVEVVSAL